MQQNVSTTTESTEPPISASLGSPLIKLIEKHNVLVHTPYVSM